MTYSGGESSSPIHYEKMLQEVTRNQPFSLISTFCFPHHSHMNLTREYTKEALDPSHDVISLPKVITMFIPTLETPLTKILNPHVPPFVNPRPLASALRIHLNTSHSNPKSCHDFVQSCRDCL